jgi:hypothetical protein
MFDLYFSEGPAVNHEDGWHAVATIVLGQDKDGFEVSLEWWAARRTSGSGSGPPGAW